MSDAYVKEKLDKDGVLALEIQNNSFGSKNHMSDRY